METKNSMSQGKIAVITGMSYLDVDRIIATTVLAKALANKHNSKIDLSLGYSIEPSKLTKFVSTAQLNVVKDITLAGNSLILDNLETEVKDVRWNQTNGKLTIELVNANGERIDPQSAKLEFSSGSYQQVYTIGVRSAKYLLRLLSNTDEQDLQEVNITSLDTVNKKDTGFAADRFVADEVHSLSAAVFTYCNAQEIPLSKSELTELLSGIYWKTNSLRNYYTTPKTHETAQQLLEKGANLRQAISNVYRSLDSALENVWKELAQSVKREGKLTIATANTERDYEDMLNNTITPIFVPQFFSETEANITSLPISNSKTLVLVSSLKAELNLHKLLRDFNPKGDDLQVKILLEEDSDTAIKQIKNALAQQERAHQVPKAVETDSKSEVGTKKEEEEENNDPLSPAASDELKALAQENEADDSFNSNNGNSLFGGFGGGGNGDPLPTAKK